MRTKAERRKNDYKHIAKKEYILKHVYLDDSFDDVTHGGQVHRLDKGKAHHHCPLNYEKLKDKNRKHSEELKINSMNDKEKDFNEHEDL